MSCTSAADAQVAREYSRGDSHITPVGLSDALESKYAVGARIMRNTKSRQWPEEFEGLFAKCGQLIMEINNFLTGYYFDTE